MAETSLSTFVKTPDMHSNITYELSVMADSMQNDYASLEKLCSNARRFTSQLDNRRHFDGFLVHSSFLLDEIENFLQERRTVQLPYVAELAQKNEEGHNCLHCSGRCDVQHTARMLELIGSNKKMQSTLDFMSSELTANYEGDELKGSLRWLNNELELAGNLLREILDTEAEVLVPLISSAQKNINVRS